MKNKLLLIAAMAVSSFSFAQSGRTTWTTTTTKSGEVVVANKQTLRNPKLFELDFDALKQSLSSAPKRFTSSKSNVIVSFPNADGHSK